MNKSTVAMLPLQSWMTYYVDDECGREENRFPAYPPVMHRDGWFWDRIAKREWYEYRGAAFLISNDGKQFIYELGLANARVLSAREVRAYQELLRTGPSKEIRIRIQAALAVDKEVKYLAGIRRGGLRAVLRFRRFAAALKAKG